MSNIKKCICEDCKSVFNENDISYMVKFCETCGSTALKYDESQPTEGMPEYPEYPEWTPEYPEYPEWTPEGPEYPTQEPEFKNKYVLGDILAIDSLGYIHIVENDNSDFNYNTYLKVFINDKVYKVMPIEYDEFTIGRNSVHFCPDLDLGTIDPEKRVSRKHALIYREDGKFYIRNLSSKNTLHVNELPVMQDDSREIKDQDLIFLSEYIVLKFEQSNI